MLRVVKAGALAALVALAACAPHRTPKTAVVVIDQLAFGPAPSGLHVGDTVTWVNHDMFEHSATAGDGSFDVDLKPGASGAVVLRRAGRIAYDCKFHPGMSGVLDVAP